MTGVVTPFLEATVRLEVLGPSGKQQSAEVILDTGFNGFLTLRPEEIASLGLLWVGQIQGVMADGSVSRLDVYRAEVIWEGSPRGVDIQAADAAPLLGMKMLRRHEVKMQVVSGGAVEITALP
jgi:clan AA aspartic protease